MGFKREVTRLLWGFFCAELAVGVSVVSGRFRAGGGGDTGGAKDAMYDRESRMEGEAWRIERMKSWLLSAIKYCI